MTAAECQVGGGGGGDCLIKLFGKTIPVPEAKDLHHSGRSSSSTESDASRENTDQDASDQSPQPEPEVVDAEDPNKSSPETPRPGDDAASLREKLKKPDKVLPCPRCSSMDTKFCYFNNYNVNQPRHFCKNCQRYWTAGGAMRNVPVGAGRRKNKHAAASHFFHRVRAVLPDAAAAGPLNTNGGGTVLSFANPALAGPCSEAEGSSNSRDHQDTTTTTSPHGGGGISREKLTVEDEKTANGGSGVLQLPSIVAAASMNNNGAAVWPSPAATYFSSGIAIPIYPAAPGYWGCCMVPPGPWSLPWPVQPPPPPQAQGLVSPTTAPPSSSSSGPGPGSLLTLGKHPRDDREGDEAKVWAPKTIRIDDADEVARSSIWSLIRTKGDDKKQDEAADHAGGRLGTVFEPKLEAKKKAMQGMAVVTGSTPPLHGHANPVALTRLVTFQEGS
ncbi:hypothetical protein U9M48_009149 [Paspalum notatum var. saurae]|uniref:Dof-type domain-containing protein n=1 Tax=Paspalum notatum var. saurae TaxID=547442 RepID=A0AAQ3WEL4_PASNO